MFANIYNSLSDARQNIIGLLYVTLSCACCEGSQNSNQSVNFIHVNVLSHFHLRNDVFIIGCPRTP